MTNEKVSRDYTVPAVDRVVRILRFLRDNKNAGASQIAAGLGIARSNCYAILKTLQSENFVSFDSDQKTYSLGLALLEMARAVSREVSVLAVARPYLGAYAKSINMSTFLLGRYGHDHLIVLDKEEPPVDIRITISTGTTTSITSGASGKCFLAFMPKDECEKLLASVPIPTMTGKTVTSKSEYRQSLERIRSDGYAMVFDEAIEGANGVAAPIFDRLGRVAFVATIVGFSWALPRSRTKVFGKELRAVADHITQESGGIIPGKPLQVAMPA